MSTVVEHYVGLYYHQGSLESPALYKATCRCGWDSGWTDAETRNNLASAHSAGSDKKQ